MSLRTRPGLAGVHRSVSLGIRLHTHASTVVPTLCLCVAQRSVCFNFFRHSFRSCISENTSGRVSATYTPLNPLHSQERFTVIRFWSKKINTIIFHLPNHHFDQILLPKRKYSDPHSIRLDPSSSNCGCYNFLVIRIWLLVSVSSRIYILCQGYLQI